jgi:ribA/ribD-fused uncharacterized protein
VTVGLPICINFDSSAGKHYFVAMPRHANLDKSVPGAVTALGVHPLETARGIAEVHAFRYEEGDKAVVALRYRGGARATDGHLLRVQLGCLYATAFDSTDCDCREQIHVALDQIARDGGTFLYFPDEDGRGHGLDDKVRELSQLWRESTEHGQEHPNIPAADLSCLEVIPAILAELQVALPVRLMTNSRRKYDALRRLGIAGESLVPLHIRLSGLSEFARRERRQKQSAERAGPIHFFQPNRRFGWLANYSAHAINLDGEVWPTVEHYYQASKFRSELIRHEIQANVSPAAAKDAARRHAADRRGDWESIKDAVMSRAVRAKFAQHGDLRARLLDLGESLIVEDSDQDDYWGIGRDGTGQNRMGKILMSLRAELRALANEVPGVS